MPEAEVAAVETTEVAPAVSEPAAPVVETEGAGETTQEPGAAAPAATPEAAPEPVNPPDWMNNLLGQISSPATQETQAPPAQTPGQVPGQLPGQVPGQPELPPFPTRELVLDDPARAFEMQTNAYNARMNQLHREMDEMKGGLTNLSHARSHDTGMQVGRALRSGRAKVGEMYKEVFGASSNYRNNPQVKEGVDDLVGNVIAQAMEQAQTTGDIRGFDVFNDDNWPWRVLRMVEAEYDLDLTPRRAIRMKGAEEISGASRGPAASPDDPTPEEMAELKKYGYTVEQWRKAKNGLGD